MDTKDFIFMREALNLARVAYGQGEVPVGAVIVKDGEIIGRGYNQVEVLKSPLKHAEIIAIEEAIKRLGAWRLTGSTLYVTLEPCPMCAGAIKNARIDRVLVGARDLKNGACGSYYDIIPAEFGILEDEAEDLLKSFFKELR
mgnify:CR=1 FL=1